MNRLKRADQEALRAMIPTRPANKGERCCECGYPMETKEQMFHAGGDGEFAYCSPNCLQVAEGVGI